jgi:hypothetical protein
MGQLRDGWSAVKKQALEDFKKTHKPDLDKVLTEGAPAFPLGFTKNLGPTLDSYEKEKAGPKKADLARKAKAIIDGYRSDIAKKKPVLGGIADHLDHKLNEIKGKVV